VTPRREARTEELMRNAYRVKRFVSREESPQKRGPTERCRVHRHLDTVLNSSYPK